MLKNYKENEGFKSQGLVSLSNNVENECPLSAEKGEDAKILVQPQNRKFDTMADYVAWLSSLSAAGSMCVPPYVKGPRAVEMVNGTGQNDRMTAAMDKQIEQQNKSGNIFTTQVEGEQTYAKTPINKADDYEYTRIFQTENTPRTQLSKTTINAKINEHQTDWAKLPFNSEARASAEDEFISGRMDDVFRDPKTGVYFKTAEGFEVQPPDDARHDAEEKAKLKKFEAKKAADLLEHEMDDVALMIKKMYAEDPDWEPVVETLGNNEYRISELRPRVKKEKYAEAQDMTVERAKDNGLISPQVSIEGGNRDPVFDKQGVVDYNNNRFWEYKDFNKWTPGLERMFAPTLDTTNWTN
jgi:hypothetical protein